MSDSQSILQALNRLAELKSALDLLQLGKQDAIKAAIPPEVAQALTDIDAEYAPMIEAPRHKSKAINSFS